MKRSSPFDLEEALLRQAKLYEARRSRERLQFRLCSLIWLTVVASVFFAVAVACFPALWNRAQLRFHLIAQGWGKETTAMDLAAPLLVPGAWIAVNIIVIFFVQRMRAR